MLLDREIDQLVTEKCDPGAVHCRTFSLSDASILILALCVALAWDRGRFTDASRWISLSSPTRPTIFFPPATAGWGHLLAFYAVNAIELLPPLLFAGSLAVLAVRLRRPLPLKRWLFWQPGASACGVASTALVVAGSLYLAANGLSYLSGGRTPAFLSRQIQEDLMPEHLTAAATAIGYGVAGTWIALATKRRWRPEPDWIDGLGRLVGVGWIVMVLGGMILPVIHIVNMGLS
jgi:hypothetical protein